MDPLQAARTRLDAYISDQGLKRTRQREVILEAFLAVQRHLSVDELLGLVQHRMAGVGSATVYRSLKLFVEAGIAEERHFQDGQTRYEPALGIDHHDHLICTSCGRIFEFEDPVIEARQAEVCRERGMVLESHRHEIYASCADPTTCPYKKASLA